MLDIGCGSGVLGAQISEIVAAVDVQATLYGIDISQSALQQYRSRVTSGSVCMADSRNLPFSTGTFEVVVSQFGVEYGGWEALLAATDVVAPGGLLALACHLAGGALQLECERNLQAIEAISKVSLLRAARNVFEWSGSGASQASQDPRFREAERTFASAVRTTEGILRSHGQGVAGGTVWRLYSDLAHMYPRMAQYDANDLQQWCSQMDDETTLYAARMRMMINAGVDPATRERYSGHLASNRFTIHQDLIKSVEPDSQPFAWILVAERRHN